MPPAFPVINIFFPSALKLIPDPLFSCCLRALRQQENSGSGISFSADGKKMFITGNAGGTVDTAGNKIHQWDLSTAFDPSTKSNLVSASLNWSADAGTSLFQHRHSSLETQILN